MPAGAVRVRVPATSANLGPGFDAFGLALDLHDDVEVEVAGAQVRVEVSGEGAGTVPEDERNLLARSVLLGCERWGSRPAGLLVRCTNRIPHGRGLGSSSAAIVGGLVAARALVGAAVDDATLLEVASEIEGHPDNVAACLLGGFTVAWTEEPRTARAVRLEPSGGLAAVAFVPPDPVATERARGLLPDVVPHADAARNAGRAALLVTALTARPDLLLTATEDRLHQSYRASAMVGSHALVEELRDDGVAAVISGAGPTVLALVPEGEAEGVAARRAPGFTARVLRLEPRGATVRGPVRVSD